MTYEIVLAPTPFRLEQFANRVLVTQNEAGDMLYMVCHLTSNMPLYYVVVNAEKVVVRVIDTTDLDQAKQDFGPKRVKKDAEPVAKLVARRVTVEEGGTAFAIALRAAVRNTAQRVAA